MTDIVRITKETASTLLTGCVTVGEEIVVLSLDFPQMKGVLLKALGPNDTPLTANNSPVFIGNKNVQADLSVLIGCGFPLGPGGFLELPIESTGKIYLVALEANQKICWMAI